MAFTIDETFLPATLTASPMTDDEFTAFCNEYPDLFFEMTSEGDIIVMLPTDFDTGVRNADLSGQLAGWARRDRRGVGTASSTGLVLPNGARRSPDVGWTLKSHCPDFVIELKSPSDRRRKLDQKMREYLANGAQLGWLIDPDQRSVTIYRQNGEVETRTGIDSIEGEGPVAGFVLDLTSVWDPFAD
jgi:Uma2 family endonuclease